MLSTKMLLDFSRIIKTTVLLSYWSNDESLKDYISDSDFKFKSFEHRVNLEVMETDLGLWNHGFFGHLHNTELLYERNKRGFQFGDETVKTN